MGNVRCIQSSLVCYALVRCRGFICAQVVAYDELFDVGGDLNLLLREKKVRQQGRKYVINGGDIISFESFTPQQIQEQNKKHGRSS